ncbi:MAG TPA: hypothetical protein VMG38_12210 [Trebonia sp.]|nr:hypothetical protein [Trebonia sp.]
MTVLVDPPPRGRPGKGSASTAKAQRQPAMSQDQAAPQATAPEGTVRLAEPPITGGQVEALMGRLIKVLAHSPLARPLPAVTLSALGLLGVAFAGLCAAAPRPSVATPPVLLPLTSVAHKLGAPHLSSSSSNLLMYVSITLCCLGLAMMLWANSHLGWAPSPRKVFAVATATLAVLVNITPVGSADIASYAAYGRIAALGQNPYTFLPSQLPGAAHGHNPYTAIINPMWRNTPSVYGPIATWVQALAAQVGGARAWVTIWVLMMLMALAFLATGYVLIRTADNPVRASLMWVANPLLIVELVVGGHLDALLALTAICAIVLSRRARTVRDDILVGLFVGISGAIKINAVYVAMAIAIPLIHDRDWKRLLRTMSFAGVTVAALYYFTWGFGALSPLRSASKMVISPTIWRLLQVWAQQVNPHSVATVTTIIGFAWPPIMLAIAWYLYNRLSPDVPTVVAATCALTFAWAIAESWSLPWYTAIAWVTLALLPRNSLTRWLTLATGALALVHFNGGWPQNMTTGPTP